MIGGQYRDITGGEGDLAELHLLKTGRLFTASIGLGLRVAGVPVPDHAAWRTFGAELGLLFQVVDDILDGDGLAARLPADEVRRLADDAADRARAELDAVSGDTSVLCELVDATAFRTG
jgi:geranylgeranyl pyrophosphate synthase